jgi:hypothetical protein
MVPLDYGLRAFGSLGLWGRGSTGQCDHGSRGPWDDLILDHSTGGLWDSGAMGLLDYGALDYVIVQPWDCATIGHGFMGPWGYGAMGLRDHGDMEPWDYGSLDSGTMGRREQRVAGVWAMRIISILGNGEVGLMVYVTFLGCLTEGLLGCGHMGPCGRCFGLRGNATMGAMGLPDYGDKRIWGYGAMGP